MTLTEAILARHSVRKYIDHPLEDMAIKTLREKIDTINSLANLHIQLIVNEPLAYSSGLAYGTFSGVSNYFVMAGKKTDDLDHKIGYYGEQLVLLAQTLGLNTCWTGLTYKKIRDTYTLAPDEKIVLFVALGYGETQGVAHKIKSIQDVSNASDNTPDWFRRGVEAALLAPTAVNQQKFFFEYSEKDGQAIVEAKKSFSIFGYTSLDLGIAKYHFEVAAGTDNFSWK